MRNPSCDTRKTLNQRDNLLDQISTREQAPQSRKISNNNMCVTITQPIRRTTCRNCYNPNHASSTTVAQINSKIDDADVGDVDNNANDSDLEEVDIVDHNAYDAHGDAVERERAFWML